MAALSAAAPEEKRLEALLGFRILDTPPEAAFDDLARLAALITETPMAVICFADRDRLWFKSRIGVPHSEVARKGSFCEESLASVPLYIVPDALEEARFKDSTLVKEGVRFYAGAPLVVGQRHVIGNLVVFDTKPRKLTLSQQDSLIVLARAVSAQLELRREVQERKRRDKIMLSLLDDLKEREKRLQDATTGLEQKVSERTAQIQATLSDLESFAFNVAHNLRAPLRAMNGFSQTLLREHGGALGAAGQDCLRRIVQGSLRLDHLISDLLAYYRLPTTKLILGPVELSAALDGVVADMAGEVRDSQARLEVAPDLPAVRADEAALRQILANLLSNALKFTPPGAAPLVRVKAESLGSRVRLWVEDRGIGIAPQDQERIFHVFERLNRMEDYPGNGIGLCIVRKSIERMGGRVGVESALGQGSRFWLELPKAHR